MTDSPSDAADAAPWQQSVYDQLHDIAKRALANETDAQSLQPTLLVNDAYMKLLERKNINSADRPQVLAAGAAIIRQMLVDHARRRHSLKRGGSTGRGISLHVSLSADDAKIIEVIELHDALESLANVNRRAARVVELKFFGGLTGEEIAVQLQSSIGTVNNEWRYAKAWLYSTLQSAE